jgi:imidazolonepropionase-like amidohydrolase
MSALRILACIIVMTTAAFAAQEKAAPGARKPPSAYLVKAKRIHTRPGSVIENASILVQDGKIAAIGPDIALPSGNTEVYEGAEITAGLIEANSTAGQRFEGVEDSSEITPSFSALANLDWSSVEFERLVKSGVTTIFAAPTNLNVVGGVASIVKTAPRGNPRAVRPAAAVKIAFGDEPTFGNFTPRGFGIPQNFHVRRPGSRPGTVMEMRMAFTKARSMVGKLGIVPPDMKPLVDVFEANFPLRARAWDLNELRSALRVAAEFDVKLTIDGAAEAHRCLPALKAAGVKLVIGPHAVNPMAGVDGRGRRIDFGDIRPAQDLLARVVAAGIPVALSANGAPVPDDLASQMRIAVRYGATPEAALAAVTTGAAEILGIADSAGTLAVGRDADLVLWSASPFDLTAKPLVVLVDGVPAAR